MDKDRERSIRLTSGEISNLWTSYMNDTMAACGIKYFLAKVEDAQVKSVLEYALELSHNHVKRIKQFFSEEQFPIPIGFTEEDVEANAPRLYSDKFFLLYMVNMGRFGLSSYSIALSTSSRADIREFYSECIASTTELFNKATEAMQEKGLHVRPPSIPTPSQAEMVHDQSFFGNFLNIGKKRPLLAVEINNLAYNIERNTLGKSLIMGFSQVAQTKEVRQYFERGRDIAQKHIEIFSEMLTNEHLQAPMTWDSEVTDSTTPPFSDKLMMYHVSGLIAAGMGQYGMAASTSPRGDLTAMYARLSVELGDYANDGANIMIQNGWLEKPPQTVDREALAKA
ncbi:hypothetical protein SD70_22825 [Gordoniibacillus kamchatkensis]|uniref:DUF3231 family protein n=1 Tax=Gordoniibacillus kamchatkensis TaxID=1590651 RepID=A0ABR5AD48_9BACL|nr:DUF3231 family protein [Paenibacillus sp. VKM B-2647]KIL38981.1 hypothetical protein SD70_22825 [Paenibacillus sp. VKM B-2647]